MLRGSDRPRPPAFSNEVLFCEFFSIRLCLLLALSSSLATTTVLLFPFITSSNVFKQATLTNMQLLTLKLKLCALPAKITILNTTLALIGVFKWLCGRQSQITSINFCRQTNNHKRVSLFMLFFTIRHVFIIQHLFFYAMSSHNIRGWVCFSTGSGMLTIIILIWNIHNVNYYRLENPKNPYLTIKKSWKSCTFYYEGLENLLCIPLRIIFSFEKLY